MQQLRTRLVAAAVAAGALTLSGCAGDLPGAGGGDADYPTRAIDLVLPFGAGGSTDIAARAMADALSDELGQPFNAANQTGAQQVTAVSEVAGSAPDGYTLLADGGGSSSIQSLLPDLPYEWDDRTFIARVATGGHAYAVGATSGVTTIDELADVATADPSEFRVAWLNGTSTSDFATLQLLDAIGVDPDQVIKVPFEGSGDAMQAAAAGDVDLATGGTSAIASLYSSGDLVPLALTAPDENFPDVPLTTDEGYPGLDMTYWVGLSGPAGLPETVVDPLADAIGQAAEDGVLDESFAKLGMTVDVVTGDKLRGLVEDEAATFADLNELAG
ncbi:Bug family tripartite tricarboxylate transporter substrate binding protein [Promicromonospora vindobonensis]|uniref:Bug family tripartite tricarboxylate transporter substrate binding protein n=1 Tax=Promicromonospora vindobonensis TaxID=195748 RepID=A0ABW5VX70_9MICO